MDAPSRPSEALLRRPLQASMTYETFLAHCEGADPDALPFSSDAMPV
jgi:hypothetical protein